MAECPFCELLSSGSPGVTYHGSAAAFFDKYPVSEGHTLVIPTRHEPDFSVLSADEQAAIWELARERMQALRETYSPDGFNVGINIGEAAGQTVGHAHLHVIPRYTDDVSDPRGGVRWVKPEQARYW